MSEYPADLQDAVDLLYRIKPGAAQTIRKYLALKLERPNGGLVDDLRLAATTIRQHASVGIRTETKQRELALADRLSLYACELLY